MPNENKQTNSIATMPIAETGTGFSTEFKARSFSSSLVGEDDEGTQYDVGHYLNSNISNVPATVSHQEVRDLLNNLYKLTTFKLEFVTETIKVRMERE